MFNFFKKLISKKKKKKEKSKTKSLKCETNKVTLKKNSASNSVKQKTSKRSRKKYGFAKTKEEPHKLHPAFYRKKSSNEIDYITFTHSARVNDTKSNKELNTIPLTSNINPNERGKRKTYIYPKTFVGKRSALGIEENNYSLTKEDKKLLLMHLIHYQKKKLVKLQILKKGNKKRSAYSNDKNQYSFGRGTTSFLRRVQTLRK